MEGAIMRVKATAATIMTMLIIMTAVPAFGGECPATKITIKGFRGRVVDRCTRTPCPKYKLTGEIINNCSIPVGVQIQIVGRDKDGMVVSVIEAWPASINNIAPGSSYPFDLGPLMEYDKAIVKFEVKVIEVKQW